MSYHHLFIFLLINIYSIKLTYSINYDSTNEYCDKKANCVALNNTKCLDITLTYKYSKLNGLLQDFYFDNEQTIHDYLNKWTGLKSVPRCWASIQPLLCTAFFPRCDEEKVSLLSFQICKNVKINCKVLDQFISSNNIKTIPSFLNCNDTNLYQPKCKNEYMDIKFNATAARCQYPLVSTDDSNIYYKNIESCALDCDDQLYHKTDKIAFQNFLISGGCISLIVVLISILSYLPKWSNLSLTSKICFYIQICFAIHYYGWLMQAMINKKQIVCRSDQTLKYSEPNGSGLLCLCNFILIYYSAFSILSWYIIMAITTLNKKFKPDLYKNSLFYLHLFAWSSSFIFTIMAIAFSQIDGNFVYGICFITFSNRFSKYIFVLLPLTFGCLIYIYGMLYRAIPVRSILQSPKLNENFIKRKDYKKIYLKLVNSSILMSLVLIFGYVAFFNKNNGSDLNEWLESLNDEILCRLNLYPAFGLKSNYHHLNCERNLKKNLTLDYLILIFVFGAGTCSSFWNFDLITILVWILEFKRKIDRTVRPDRLDDRNVFFEKLLHNKQDPVKMNLDTWTTNQFSNNQNIRELNQNKMADSSVTSANQLTNSKKLFEQKQLEKKRAKLETKKNQKLDSNQDLGLIQNTINNPLNNYINPNFNSIPPLNPFTNLYQPQDLFNGLMNLPNGNLPNNLIFNNNGLLNNNNLLNNQPNNLINNNSVNNQLNKQTDHIARLNELKRKENKNLDVFLTHGMSDQNKVNHVINPFDEYRRPDSKLELNKPSTNQLNENQCFINQPNENASNNLMVFNTPKDNIQNSFIVQNENLLKHNMNNQMNINSLIPSPSIPNPFLVYLFCQQQNQMRQNYLNYLQSNLANQQIFNDPGPHTAQNYEDDLINTKKEISKTIHITYSVDSSSEANDHIIPINESDMSSTCSFDTEQDNKLDIGNLPDDLKKVFVKLEQLNDHSSDEKSKKDDN